MKELDQLTEIFLADDLDEEEREDNRQQIVEWQEQLYANELLVDWQQHAITKNIVSQARQSYVDLSVTLVRNRDLTDTQRASIYARQDAMKWLLTLSSTDAQGEIKRIEADIRKALNATN